ncbi:major facilitator superfamily MFS_1 [Rubrobacter xylanophilus DSM 9941]|uniref:Major facilitator superfamily MFS_1 n=2 Tax=Rubrobacter xylanophilus TaxID=49319 RepID=Q1ARN9_RUBXD|nr:major facilitator superfamily MFS_1 [Rubrobacter xylanophilus DSM 9941]
MSRPMAFVLLAALGTFTNVNLLLPVMPLYVARSGAGDFFAGLATTALLLTTVVAQIGTPRVLGRCGYSSTLIAGMVLLGVPSAFYVWTDAAVPLLGITLVRGLGFGVATVAFAALVTDLSPPERRGEGIGLYGVASTLPAVFGLPLGLWLVNWLGYETVFLAGAAGCVVGVAGVLAARVNAVDPPDGSAGFVAGMRRSSLRRPLFAFVSTTVAAGVLVTFLPLASPGSGLDSAATALLLWGLVQTAARWWAGRATDRSGAERLIQLSLVLSGLGMLAVSLPENPVMLLTGAVLNGVGFGVLQNATLSVLTDRVPRSEYGMISTLWNVGFDAGAGASPLVFGLIAAGAGYPFAFAATAALIFASLVFARPDAVENKT